MEIKLKEPITFDGQRVSALNMHPPKVKDQLKAESHKGTDAEKEIRLMAVLCGVQMELIEELSLNDYRQIQEAFNGFL